VGLIEECKRRENDKYLNSSNAMNKIVYDCVDASPYYEAGTYFDDVSKGKSTIAAL
jgi:hypothetical protein